MTIDLTPRPVRARWLLLGLLASAIPVLADNMNVSSYYPAPFAQYSTILTTGDTLLGRFAGNVGVGLGAQTPNAPFVVFGNTLVGGVGNRGFESLSLVGQSAGILMDDRSNFGAPGQRWSQIAHGDGTFTYWKQSHGDVLKINNDGRVPLCQPVAYVMGTANTYCPASRPYAYFQCDAAGNRVSAKGFIRPGDTAPAYTGQPGPNAGNPAVSPIGPNLSPGYMMCCSMYHN